MDLLQILILAVVQGAAELLPVSSSAHVIVAEKLMGLDPTAPQMTLLLVMLHTGTMFAVIAYFWNSWRATYFESRRSFRVNALHVAVATMVTGVVGLTLQSLRSAAWIGAVQGLCLPFRGFSRSGATISTGLALGVSRRRAEEFSFALAVVLTPAVIVKEAHRLYQAQAATTTAGVSALWQIAAPSLLGMALSFVAGLIALRWLTRWLEHGRWHWFGAYRVVASLVVLWVG
jgi:undecaprenyl-diphosphatase